MSLICDGQQILCDGDKCKATAHLPVALRPMLTLRGEPETQTTAGWLFVGNRGAWQHFCPRCATRYLRVLSQTPLLDLGAPR
ncbi:MAG TPA: hypothetical protein VFB21_14350 [Chthonomonadaceae bacterium]|nr:hypothetical protein [Chthonomonadaceae bacterium]